MKPRGPMMIEHRLIEKMLKITGKEVDNIKKTKKVDSIFIDTIVDFIRTYADRTHHGKEEDILFRELEKKKMNSADTRLMRELIDEHIKARKIVGELVKANSDYIAGNSGSIEIIIDRLDFLINFYPVHIKKEDDVFFPDTEKYFTAEELDKMLNDFWEFDRKMIHEKYNRLYDTFSKQ